MKTEWGIQTAWGQDSVASLESAESIKRNMEEAGLHATVIWRGITDWQEVDSLDD